MADTPPVEEAQSLLARIAALEIVAATANEQTAAAKARAEEEAQARRAAEAQVRRATEALAEALASRDLTPQAVGLPAPPGPRAYSKFLLGQAAFATFKCESPSKKNGVLLQVDLTVFSMDQPPHVPELLKLSQIASLAKLHAAGSPTSLLSEEANYSLATHFFPKWIQATSRSATLNKGARQAKTLFGYAGTTPPNVPNMSLPWNCYPELLTSAPHMKPAFNGELKSAASSGDLASPKLFDEVVTYVTLGIVATLYRQAPSGRRRFFSTPPVGYGLVGIAHVSYLIAIEWIGKVFVSMVSQPFYLGSPEHEAAIAKLPDFTFEPVDLSIDDAPVGSWPSEGAPKVLWRNNGAEGDEFFKVITCGAYRKEYFERMYLAYSALALAQTDTVDPAPSSLLPARLLFGAGEVCVTMPWVEGRDGTAADLHDRGCAVEPVARAIAWLARQGLVYTDLRPPNVRISGSDTHSHSSLHVVLVDYDDMEVAGGAVRSFPELQRRLREAGAPWADAGGPAAVPAVMLAVEASWSAWGGAVTGERVRGREDVT